MVNFGIATMRMLRAGPAMEQTRMIICIHIPDQMPYGKHESDAIQTASNPARTHADEQHKIRSAAIECP